MFKVKKITEKKLVRLDRISEDEKSAVNGGV